MVSLNIVKFLKEPMLYVVTISLLILGCENHSDLTIHVANGKEVHSEIRGDNLYDFFLGKPYFGVEVINIENSEVFIDELRKINTELLKPEYANRTQKDISEGIFKFAFLYDNDTLYASVWLTSWLKGNNGGFLETSESFKNEFSKYVK